MSLPPFQLLLDRHHADVQRFLAALVGPGEAGDVAQETWLAALRAYPRLRSSENLRGWLLTIAHRKALDHLRRTARLPHPAESLPEVPAPPAPAPELDGDVWRLVRGLPGKQRGAVALRYLLDLSYEEIGRSLECSEEAARRSVHEGLKRLRREYADDVRG